MAKRRYSLYSQTYQCVSRESLLFVVPLSILPGTHFLTTFYPTNTIYLFRSDDGILHFVDTDAFKISPPKDFPGMMGMCPKFLVASTIFTITEIIF